MSTRHRLPTQVQGYSTFTMLQNVLRVFYEKHAQLRSDKRPDRTSTSTLLYPYEYCTRKSVFMNEIFLIPSTRGGGEEKASYHTYSRLVGRSQVQTCFSFCGVNFRGKSSRTNSCNKVCFIPLRFEFSSVRRSWVTHPVWIHGIRHRSIRL